MKNTTSRTAGFTLVEIMIVVAIIGMLAALAIPNLVRARSTAQTKSCINNLRQIDAAKQQWAMETRQPAAAVAVKADLDPYLGRAGNAANVLCPSGGLTATFDSSYNLDVVTNVPTCKIFTTSHVLN